MEQAKVFQALGDESRLAMLERLVSGKPQTLSSLSEDLNMSRQGARKHIQVLEDVGLVVVEMNGRTALIKMNTAPLERSTKFLESLELKWKERLTALKQYLEND